MENFSVLKARLTEKMTHFYAGSVHDIDHFLKVTAYAELIGTLEQLPEDTLQTLVVTAIVHDISCPLCREKYGSAGGKQQETESEALLRPFLAEFDLPPEMLQRVIFIVTHHHTYTGVDGADWQIMLEADFMVNASESNMSPNAIRNFAQQVFRTPTGLRLLHSVHRGAGD